MVVRKGFVFFLPDLMDNRGDSRGNHGDTRGLQEARAPEDREKSLLPQTFQHGGSRSRKDQEHSRQRAVRLPLPDQQGQQDHEQRQRGRCRNRVDCRVVTGRDPRLAHSFRRDQRKHGQAQDIEDRSGPFPGCPRREPAPQRPSREEPGKAPAAA